MDKIKGCKIDELFGEIHIVGKDKNEAIKSLKDKFQKDEFIFIDNNLKNIEMAMWVDTEGQKLHRIHYPDQIDEFRKLIK